MCVKWYKVSFFVFLVGLLLIVTGCGATPKPPKITQIIISDSLLVNQPVPVQVDFTTSDDYETAEIAVYWEAQKGEISANQSHLVTYIAPSIQGLDTITVKLQRKDTNEVLDQFSKDPFGT